MNSDGKHTRYATGGQVRGQVWWKCHQQMRLEGPGCQAREVVTLLRAVRATEGDFPEGNDLVTLVKACCGGCGESMGIRVLNQGHDYWERGGSDSSIEKTQLAGLGDMHVGMRERQEASILDTWHTSRSSRLREVEMLKCPRDTLGEYLGGNSGAQGWR